MSKRRTTDKFPRPKLPKPGANKPEGKIDNPFIPTQEQWDIVYSLAKDGLSVEQIRPYIHNSKGYAVSYDTVEKYYRDAFDAGVADMTLSVSQRLIRTAHVDDTKKPNPIVNDARKFILSRRGGWSEKQEKLPIELTGKDGEAIEHEHNVTVDASAELAAIFGQIKRTKAGSSEEDTSVVSDGEG